MKNKFIFLLNLAVFLLFFTLSVLYAQSNEESVLRLNKIVRTIDELYRSKSSFALIEMKIVTSNWQRTLKMKAWTEGRDKTFIRIIEPKKEQGVGTLRIKNEMWNYLPKTNKIIKIPPSMMMSSWMGSDFNNDDLVNEYSLLTDYTYHFITPQQPQAGLIYIECSPKEGLPIIWKKVIMSVRQEDYLPVKEEYYDEKEQLIRTINYQDIRNFNDRKIPATMELIPHQKQGNKTVLKYDQIQFDIAIDQDIFSERNLRRVE
jgi:outer membrane lipoprotein-sorting protein